MSTNDTVEQSWRSVRRERRERRHNSPTGGLILVALGIIFLAQQTGWFEIHNWWAIFILIPAIGSFGACVTLYRRSGGLSQGVRESFFGGLMILTVALVFLLDLSWEVYWPAFLVLPGLSLCLAGLPLGDEPYRLRGYRIFVAPWAVATGLGVALLGAGFLLRNLGVFDPTVIQPRWWALPIFLPALGGLIATLALYRQDGRFGLAATSSLAAAVVVAAVATTAALGLDWNLLAPVLMIAAGLVVLLGVLGGQRQGNRS